MEKPGETVVTDDGLEGVDVGESRVWKRILQGLEIVERKYTGLLRRSRGGLEELRHYQIVLGFVEELKGLPNVLKAADPKVLEEALRKLFDYKPGEDE